MFRFCRVCCKDSSDENASEAYDLRAPAAWRPICKLGAKCTLRMDPAHLEAEAHVWDPDYQDLCEQHGIEPLEASLRVLFDWVDLDGSGKVSRQELGSAMPFLSKYFGDDMRISKQSWEELDEDGNGYVNFSEFAEWAGPRLGLPLGVGHLFGKNNSNSQNGLGSSCCGILNCPCKEYREKTPGICRCGHKKSAHHSAGSHASQVPYPSYWKNVGSTTDFVDLVPLAGENRLFQDLFDHTHIKRWTRDRIKHTGTKEIPKRYVVTKVWRVENSKTWREFCVKKALMMEAKQGDAKDYKIFSDVKSSLAWVASSPDLGDQSLEQSVNEWYLFHGCQEKAARGIATHDFKIGLAGNNTGTLYGRGSYFAESCTKADEYSKPNSENEFCLLLCRALGGNVRYTAAVTPDPDALVKDCIEGPYECILGDREKCRNTFREFVFYDTENLYAEYIINYRRVH